MMSPTVFVYEHLTALGLGRDPADPLHSMYLEGLAMREAVAADFRALGHAAESTDLSAKLFRENLRKCDISLLIAPDRELAELVREVEAANVESLNSAESTIRIAACKIDMGRLWEETGVLTPRAMPFLDWFLKPTRFPIVCKPIHGVGSSSIFTIADENGIQPALRRAESEGENETSLLLQEWVPGRAASIAFLCGPAGNFPLIPAFQTLSADGRCHYLGGELPIPAALADRAVKLGSRALECLPGLKGYVGVDLVLGEAADGSEDFAIEVNPRLTTSYIGLRAMAGFNLAEAMLFAARGEPIGTMRWKRRRVRFSPDGRVAPADQV